MPLPKSFPLVATSATANQSKSKNEDATGFPAVGLGTFQPQAASHEVVKTAVLTALAAGYRHLDTAFMYGNGEVERAVGSALEEWEGKREDVWVVTKLANAHHRPSDVAYALNLSLGNLKLDYVDLYLMHYPIAYERDDDYEPKRYPNKKPILDFALSQDYASTWRAMEDLVYSGKIKHIGVSNFSILKLQKLLQVARIKPAVNQIEMHPYLPQHEMLDFCQIHNIHVSAHSPLGGKPVAQVALKAHLPGPMQDPLINAIAAKFGKSASTILLAWAIQRGTSVIPKSYNPLHIKSNLTDLEGFELPEDDFEAIESLKNKETQIRFMDPSEHWGFDIFDEEKDEPAVPDTKLV